ncbi:MAG: hypothetical protein GF317_12725 [Candidatus Lokiarchaeota archaeon]|nr:hypothetical protein [Candidatus Lokiarchaeota archaeon]MBD3200505.1 hypothetical protein [Candidatus Lokiarchaeota archaeon]
MYSYNSYSNLTKLKSFKKDIAPIGFFFDIVKNDNFKVPILPVPMRIDKLTNGEPTIFILPEMDEINTFCQNHGLFFNCSGFYLIGIKNLISFAKTKYKEMILRSLPEKKIKIWWNSSKRLSANYIDLKESFTFILIEFLAVFKHIKENLLKINQEEYTEHLIQYCDIIITYFRTKIENNVFRLQKDDEIIEEKLYIEKKQKYYPLTLKINVCDVINNKTAELDFIPYLIYDDILNCFSFNKSVLLNNDENKKIDLKVYEDYNLINNRSDLIEQNGNLGDLDIDCIRKLKLDHILQI